MPPKRRAPPATGRSSKRAPKASAKALEAAVNAQAQQARRKKAPAKPRKPKSISRARGGGQRSAPVGGDAGGAEHSTNANGPTPPGSPDELPQSAMGQGTQTGQNAANIGQDRPNEGIRTVNGVPPGWTLLQPSSPLFGSSPPPTATYELCQEMQLYINGSRAFSRPLPETPRLECFGRDVESFFERLMEKDAIKDRLAGQEYRVETREAMYKPQANRAVQRFYSLDDFSDLEMEKFYCKVDEYFAAFQKSCRSVSVVYTVKIKYTPKVRAFNKNPEPSSDGVDGSFSRQTRTVDLTREERLKNKYNTITSSTEFEMQIHQNWRCSEPDCTNFGAGYCWVHPASKKHFKIEPIDVQSWVNKIPGGTAWTHQPPSSLIEIWEQRRGECKRKSKGRQGERDSRESGAGNNDSTFDKFLNKMAKMVEVKMMYGMGEMADSIKPTISDGNKVPAAPQSASVSGGEVAPQTNPPSSPINGVKDSLLLVEKFFEWAMARAPTPKAKAAYAKAKDVAEEQCWTLGDLKSMSNPRGELYKIAREERLADGIVRGFREAITEFKAFWRLQFMEAVTEEEENRLRNISM